MLSNEGMSNIGCYHYYALALVRALYIELSHNMLIGLAHRAVLSHGRVHPWPVVLSNFETVNGGTELVLRIPLKLD